MLSVILGAFVTARALAPTGLSTDPADEGYCDAYGIVIDASQVEAIYLHPETVLADPEAFLSSDPASIRFGYLRAGYGEPLNVNRWVRQVESIANMPVEKRERQISYRLSREVLAGQETFCRIASPLVLSYLPEEVRIDVAYYQAALDPLEVGFTDRGGIVTAVSHPVYRYAERLFGQGKSAIYNNMTHELFHYGYLDSWLWQTEDPVENSALRELIRFLQNEGLAVNAGYRIREYYPSTLRYAYPLVHFRPLYRYMFGQVNKVLENAESKTAEELSQDVWRLYRGQAKYYVSGYMAVRIEDQLGKEALANTVKAGPRAFIQTYNSVAEEGMELHFTEPAFTGQPVYRDLRTAALEGDLARVREIVQDIESGQTSLADAEVEGYLVYSAGYILLRSGHVDLAEKAFRLLNSSFPEVGAGYIGLGEVYEQRGETDTAIENYERALELGVHNQWVKVLIAEQRSQEP